MCRIPLSSRRLPLRAVTILLVAAMLCAGWTRPAWGQTVGDTFIDTSEWVQSSSPIRDEGTVRGYITETIVRGYRGPGYDQYYGGGDSRSAIEFSRASRIQPIVYENSAPDQPPPPEQVTSLDTPIRPTPDPVVQASNQWPVPGQFNRPDSATPLSGMRGFATQASYQQPVQAQPWVQGNRPSIPVSSYHSVPGYPAGGQQWIQTGYQPQGYANGYSAPVYPSPAYGGSPYYASAPASYSAPLTNCCDPIYAQTQFVSPNMYSGAGSLQTYPQYGGNPYPNAGYGISQPYVRETWVPMIPLRSMPYGTYLGQGIIGQPVAYVDGEPVRNFLRYIFP